MLSKLFSSMEPPNYDRKIAEFKEYYSNEYDRLLAAENAFSNLVRQLVTDSDEFPSPTVGSRVKDRDECLRKFDRNYRSDVEKEGADYKIQDRITDLIGVRVICLYETDIPLICAILEDNFATIDRTDKTSKLESKDDTFGYKGYHFDLKLNENRISLPEYRNISDLQFEAQVRTIVQDAWSTVDHKIKYKKTLLSR